MLTNSFQQQVIKAIALKLQEKPEPITITTWAGLVRLNAGVRLANSEAPTGAKLSPELEELTRKAAGNMTGPASLRANPE